VFAVGGKTLANGSTDLAVVAYLAATGATLWVGSAAGGGSRQASGAAVSTDGNFLYVSGSDKIANSFLLVAYRTGTGQQLWTAKFHGPGVGGTSTGVAVSPNGSTIYVTGQNSRFVNNTDFATVSFTSTGAQRWASWFDGTGHQGDWPLVVSVSPTMGDVFVTGYSESPLTGSDFATVAYQG
jgi:DNA-binding beta-propeller fold protein YncE